MKKIKKRGRLKNNCILGILPLTNRDFPLLFPDKMPIFAARKEERVRI